MLRALHALPFLFKKTLCDDLMRYIQIVTAGGAAVVDDGDGSSIEEEGAYDKLPVYTHPVEFGPNGYAVRVLFCLSTFQS